MKKQLLFFLTLQTISIASLYSPTSVGKEAFRQACKQNKTEEVKKILEKSNRSTCTELMNTDFIEYKEWFLKKFPLFLAIENQNFKLINILIAHGADPNIRNDSGQTPLIALFQKGKNFTFATVQTLLNAGADPNIIDNYNHAPLEAFIYYQPKHFQTTAIIQALIDAGADPHHFSKLSNNNSLILAAEVKNIEAIKLLLKYKVNPNAQDNTDKDNPLILFLQKDLDYYFKIDTIPKDLIASTTKEILDAGANPFLQNIYKINAIYYAKKNHPLVCIVLSDWIQETLLDNTKIFLHRFYNYINETCCLHGNFTNLLHSIKNNDIKTIKKHIVDYLKNTNFDKHEIKMKQKIQEFLFMSKEDDKKQIVAVKKQLRNESRELMDSVIKNRSAKI